MVAPSWADRCRGDGEPIFTARGPGGGPASTRIDADAASSAAHSRRSKATVAGRPVLPLVAAVRNHERVVTISSNRSTRSAFVSTGNASSGAPSRPRSTRW